jgi:HAD superfamily hydrolase (TIGR01450 family)
MTWVLDCDGVVWLTDEPIPGAAEAVARLHAGGRRVVFLTNNSWPRRSEHLEKLRRMGMPTADEDLISSPMAAASLLEPGERALVLGGPGVLEALTSRGVEVVEPDGARGSGEVFSAVVVGFDAKFDFDRLAAATKALRAGARLIGTNDDATFPTAHGLLPGAGSFVAAVAKAGGVAPVIGGKPFEPVADLVRERVGAVEVVVGDRPSTDGRFARLIGATFGLVLTGVTPAGHGPVDPAPDVEAGDLLQLVEAVLSR